MRRLPIFIVIDVSESMAGDPIIQVEEGMRTIVSELKKDPYALETVYISVIVFAGVPKTLVPLTDIISFYPPRLSIGAGTGYGAVLTHLMTEIKNNVKVTTPNQKGDWKPVVYFMTDGNPTDDYTIDLGVWERIWQPKTNTVVVSIGNNSDHEILNKISKNILHFDESDADAYAQFFKWVTGSIKTQSQKVEESSDDSMDPISFDQDKLKKVQIDEFSPKRSTDEQYAIFYGKCQSTKKDYLIKYKRSQENLNFGGLHGIHTNKFRLEGSYTLDTKYNELSTPGSKRSHAKVSTEDLLGVPTCPACANRFAMAMCSCEGLFCVDGGGMHTCPNCNTTSSFGQGDQHFDIGRQQG